MSNLTALVVAGGLLLQASLVSSAVLRHSDAPATLVAARVDERSNPLLQEGELPPFALVKDEHAKPAVESRLSGGKTKLADLEASLKKKLDSSKEPVPYEAFFPQLAELYDYVGHPWDMIQHLKATKDSPGIRAAVEEMQPKVTAFWQSVSQSKPIYEAFLRLKNSAKTFDALPEAHQRIVQGELLNRQLGGVGLSGSKADEFNAVQTKLGKLSQTFSNHALDARKAFSVTLTAKQDVQGIPERALVAAAEAAKQAGHKDATAEKGPWVLTLDAPILGPVMSFAENRELREKMYHGFITLASKGDTDNSGTILDILKLRQQEATLLGYKNYAELSFASKMATGAEVHKLLDDLQAKAKPSAVTDDEQLMAFAKKQGFTSELKHWDRGFFVQKLQKAEYEIDAEEMRNYFPFPAVVQGVLGLSERLFGVTAEKVTDAPDALWHEDVTLYRIRRDKATVGYVFFDPYSRPAQKRAGGWLQPIVSRSRTSKGIRLPVASIQANFPAPAPEKPALLSLGECDTLFHEFGHALQHVLTKQDDAAVSGINGVEWDAVEIASQFMEYWIHFDRKTLYSFAKHWKTGEALPEVTYQRLKKSHNFRAGTVMTSQVYMSKMDLRLHESYTDGEDPNAIEKSIAKEVLPVQPLAEARPLCTFSHIFAGGYSAGYYSYKWSEVLSADAFATFEAGGALEDDSRARAIGRKFASTLLALGGGRAPGLVFKDFVGRAPSTEALLRYQGLSGAPAEAHKASFLAAH
jgi:oligopeptidase A